MTSPSLLLRVRDADDADSWSTFESIYGAIVRKYCEFWRLQASDIDDVVQEVMSAVATGIRSFDYDPAKGRFRAWLGTVTANKIKKFFERRSSHRTSELTFEPESTDRSEGYSDPDTNWVEIFSERILIEACRRVQCEFEERTWQCFKATWIDNLSATEVAERHGVSVHAVYVNKSRVMKRLEQEILLLAEDAAVPNG